MSNTLFIFSPQIKQQRYELSAQLHDLSQARIRFFQHGADGTGIGIPRSLYRTQGAWLKTSTSTSSSNDSQDNHRRLTRRTRSERYVSPFSWPKYRPIALRQQMKLHAAFSYSTILSTRTRGELLSNLHLRQDPVFARLNQEPLRLRFKRLRNILGRARSCDDQRLLLLKAIRAIPGQEDSVYERMDTN